MNSFRLGFLYSSTKSLLHKSVAPFTLISQNVFKKNPYIFAGHLDLVAKKYQKGNLMATLLHKKKLIVPTKRLRTPEDKILLLAKNKEGPGVILARDEFDDIDFVIDIKQARMLIRQKNAFERVFTVQVNGEDIQCLLEEVYFYKNQSWLKRIDFKRFIVGRPNLVSLPVHGKMTMRNMFISSGTDVKKAFETIDVLTYTENFPSRLEVSLDNLSPDRGYVLGDLMSILPEGVVLHPKYKHRLATNLFSLDEDLYHDWVTDTYNEMEEKKRGPITEEAIIEMNDEEFEKLGKEDNSEVRTRTRAPSDDKKYKTKELQEEDESMRTSEEEPYESIFEPTKTDGIDPELLKTRKFQEAIELSTLADKLFEVLRENKIDLKDDFAVLKFFQKSILDMTMPREEVLKRYPEISTIGTKDEVEAILEFFERPKTPMPDERLRQYNEEKARDGSFFTEEERLKMDFSEDDFFVAMNQKGYTVDGLDYIKKMAYKPEKKVEIKTKDQIEDDELTLNLPEPKNLQSQLMGQRKKTKVEEVSKKPRKSNSLKKKILAEQSKFKEEVEALQAQVKAKEKDVVKAPEKGGNVKPRTGPKGKRK